MCVKARRPPTITGGLLFLGGRALLHSHRIERLENQAAVVAQQFMHANHSQKEDSIVIISLNTLTLASRTLHAVHSSRSWNQLCVIMRTMKDSNENLASATYKDPLIEAFKQDIDVTLIRENLRLTVDQRFRQLMKLQEFAEELRRAGRKARLQK